MHKTQVCFEDLNAAVVIATQTQCKPSVLNNSKAKYAIMRKKFIEERYRDTENNN